MNRHSTLLSLLSAPLLSLPAAAPAAEPIAVGSVSDLDLEAFGRVVEESQPSPLPAPTSQRTVTLEESIVIALESNLRLQIAQLELEATEPLVAETRADFHPLLGASALATGTKVDQKTDPDEFTNTYAASAFAEQNVPTGATLTVSADYLRDQKKRELVTSTLDRTLAGNAPVETIGGFTIEARQPLLRGGRIYVARRRILDSEFDVEIVRAALNAEILRVTAETKAAYYEAIRSTRLVEVAEDAIRRNRDLVEASKALFEAGRVNKRDVYSAEITLAKSEAALASRQAGRLLAQNNLRDVLGLPIDLQVDIADQSIPFRPVELRLEEWIRSAFENRPELLQIRKRLEKAELETHVRENSVLPQFDAFGLYRRAADTTSHDWESGVQLSIPFGNVGARSALSRARIQTARIERQYVQQERAIELEVRALEILLRESIGRLEADTRGVVNARGKREIAAVRFQLGLANNKDITDADEDLLQAESNLLSVVAEYATNLARLEAAIARPI